MTNYLYANSLLCLSWDEKVIIRTEVNKGAVQMMLLRNDVSQIQYNQGHDGVLFGYGIKLGMLLEAKGLIGNKYG